MTASPPPNGWANDTLLRCPEDDEGLRASDPRFACRIAHRGATYQWAFSSAGDPAPSVASLFVSQAVPSHGVTHSAATFARSGTDTLAERLRSAGYTNGGFTGRARLNRSRDLDQGFDVYWVGGDDPGDPIRAAAAWIELQSAGDAPWFAWIDLPEEPDPGAAVQLAELLDREGEGGRPLAAVAVGIPNGPAQASRTLSGAPSDLAFERVRIPLVYRPPGGVPAIRVEVPVSLVDVAPTLARAATVDGSPNFEGERLPTGHHPDGAPRSRALLVTGRDASALVLGGRYYLRRPPVEAPEPSLAGYRGDPMAWTARLEEAARNGLTRVAAGEAPTGPSDQRLRERMGWDTAEGAADSYRAPFGIPVGGTLADGVGTSPDGTVLPSEENSVPLETESVAELPEAEPALAEEGEPIQALASPAP